jgi:hypothetical protein
MNSWLDSWFHYKNRIRRARDMPSSFTVALVGASLAGNRMAAAITALARANAR